MSERRQVWHTLSSLLARLEKDLAANRAYVRAVAPGNADQEIRKLGREQFKANVLAEKQASQLEKALAAVQEAQVQQARLLEERSAQQVAAAQHELLQAILPALDGLETAIASGQRYLQEREEAADDPVADDPAGSDLGTDPAHPTLAFSGDRAMLTGWLGGLGLVRERLLAVLKAGGVTPIPAAGQPFDPYLHVAVGTTMEGDGPPGTIVAEERRGYRSAAGVLRYAEVIVYRSEKERT